MKPVPARLHPIAKLALVIQLFGLVFSGDTAEPWTQFKYDSRHSGNVPDRSVVTPLGLVGAVPLTDAIFTSPVLAGGRVYAVDGSGVAFCIDSDTLRVRWRFPSPGGPANCNNVSSPALAGPYLHFGTMAGTYYVLEAESGRVIREIPCGEPIFSSPIVSGDRVYFATLGSRLYALDHDGTTRWEWDFVRELQNFNGNRWSGADWLAHKRGARVNATDQFCCVRDLAAHDGTILLPAGGQLVWLKDLGEKPQLLHRVAGREATLGLSLGEDLTVYRQWHLLDNGGRVDVFRSKDGKWEKTSIKGTTTGPTVPGLLSFASVSIRGQNIYRCRPEEGFGLCRHGGAAATEPLDGYASICPPILLRDTAVYGGLDGGLYVSPLAGGPAWSFPTPFAKPITAPAAVCDGRIYFGCEDGYLYVLGPGGNASPPTRDLALWKIRSPLTSKLADAKYDWFTSYGGWSNPNASAQDLKPPFRLKWVRRFDGTVKHFSTCGAGALYTHTAEGQIFATEQETGRLLWRRYWPGVHLSHTSPLYYQGRLLVPQAGLDQCRLRCLDATTGQLLWETPFSGSPSWNRQLPPIVHQGLVFYMFGTGQYVTAWGQEKTGWLFEHQDVKSFPPDHKPLVKAWNLDTGREIWSRDFSEFGAGGDEAGLCLMNDTLYYSSFFGYMAKRRGQPGPKGITAALDPGSGRTLWLTTNHCVHGGCTISGRNNRLYLGGYNRIDPQTDRRHVWCLDARDGSLLWESDPLTLAIQVVTVGEKFLFTHAQYKHSFLIDKDTGKILNRLDNGYKCTRFTFSDPYLLAANLDVHDLSANRDRLVSSGPALDPSECVGPIPSNGRLFYTGHGGGLQASQVPSPEADAPAAVWEKAPRAAP